MIVLIVLIVLIAIAVGVGFVIVALTQRSEAAAPPHSIGSSAALTTDPSIVGDAGRVRKLAVLGAAGFFGASLVFSILVLLVNVDVLVLLPAWAILAVVAILVTVAVSKRTSKPLLASAPPSREVGRTVHGQPIYLTTGTNGLAIASLVLALVLPIVGFILGFVARSQTRRTGQDGAGLALAAIIVGGVFTVINVVGLIVLISASQGVI